MWPHILSLRPRCLLPTPAEEGGLFSRESKIEGFWPWPLQGAAGGVRMGRVLADSLHLGQPSLVPEEGSPTDAGSRVSVRAQPDSGQGLALVKCLHTRLSFKSAFVMLHSWMQGRQWISADFWRKPPAWEERSDGRARPARCENDPAAPREETAFVIKPVIPLGGTSSGRKGMLDI